MSIETQLKEFFQTLYNKTGRLSSPSDSVRSPPRVSVKLVDNVRDGEVEMRSKLTTGFATLPDAAGWTNPFCLGRCLDIVSRLATVEVSTEARQRNPKRRNLRLLGHGQTHVRVHFIVLGRS